MLPDHRLVWNWLTWSDNSFNHWLNCNNGSGKPKPAVLGFNITTRQLTTVLFYYLIQQTRSGIFIMLNHHNDVFRRSQNPPRNMAPPDKGLLGGQGSMFITKPPILRKWVEMVLICRASQSPSYEHQVLTIMHLSIASSIFSWECAFYCSAVMMYINKQGVSTFRLSA